MIGDIEAAIAKRTDAHELFIHSAALAIISNNFGEYIRIPLTNKVLKPNIYLMLIGPAHVSRKSTMLGFIKQMTCITKLPMDVTYQYFLDALSANSVAWQCVDEVSEILQQYLHSTNEVYKQMKRMYLLLFNNEEVERGTKSGGDVAIADSFFNFISGTTTDNAFTYLTDHHTISSGFIPRFLMPCISDSEIKRKRMIYMTQTSDLDAIMQRIKDVRTSIISAQQEITVYFTDDAFDKIDDFEEETVKNMKDSVLLPIIARYTDYLFKLSALYEVDAELTKQKTGEVKLPARLVVSMDSVYKSILFITKLLTRLNVQFNVHIEVNAFNVAYQRVLDAIKRGKHTQVDIYRSAHTDSATTKKVLETLLMQEKIKAIPSKGGKHKFFATD